MTGLDHTDAEWADGPALMRWLDAHVAIRPATTTWRKRLERWRGGGQASFYRVDELLVAHGLHVSQIPCTAWKTYNNGRCRVAASTELAA